MHMVSVSYSRADSLLKTMSVHLKMVQRIRAGKCRKLGSLDIRCMILRRNSKKRGPKRKARVDGKIK